MERNSERHQRVKENTMKHAQQLLIDSFVDDECDFEHSGVRSRAPVTIELGADPTEQPTAVYASVIDARTCRRRYYLGVLFPTGVIPVECWQESMERDGLPPEAIAAAATWLRDRAI
jgi:hypothetical protein